MNDNLRGALLMLLAMALFRLNETCTKLLAESLPLTQIVTLRGIIISLGTLAIAWRMRALSRPRTRRGWTLLSVRSLSEVGAAFLFLLALINMPLANLTAIAQSAPLLLTLTAALFLKEPLGWRRLSAILTGLLGVLIIVRPGPDGFSIFAAYALGSVVIGILRDLTTRRMPREISSMTVTLCSAATVTGCFGLAALVSGDDWQPIDLWAAALILGAAIAVLIAFIASITAMRIGDLAYISPFRYSGLVWALVIGFVVFDDWPSGSTLLGAAIVVGSGLFMIYRERRLGLLHSPKAPPGH
ncbi:DMT family transporter [Pseudooceanicola sp.]|uniref:DMT family transporter n=1 Tax=Pseudooceanicola sp. TaxID=1914328 RepID=UPI0026103C1B|nr:DMT family transporter [Pseudooceanicola sp.]MDF1857244.1 DMT family transporter [Pseudooceanicola sp.]